MTIIEDLENTESIKKEENSPPVPPPLINHS